MMDEQVGALGRTRTSRAAADEDGATSNTNGAHSHHNNINDNRLLPTTTHTKYDHTHTSSTQSDIRTSGGKQSNSESSLSLRHSSQAEDGDQQHEGRVERASLVSGGSETNSYNTAGSGSNRLADISQGSGSSSVLGGRGHSQHQAVAQQEPVNFGGGSGGGGGDSFSSPNRATGGGDGGISRRVTLTGGSTGNNSATSSGLGLSGTSSGGGGIGGSFGMVATGAAGSTTAAAATAAGILPTANNRRNSLSSLSLMDDIFGKRASMGLGSTAATALSAMGAAGAGAAASSGALATGMGSAGMGGISGTGGSSAVGAGDMDSTTMMSVVGIGGANLGGAGGSMFGRRGSMDSTTAALDAAIFDLTRRRYSMANSSLVGSSGGAGAIGSLGAATGPGAGAATINSLVGGDRSYGGGMGGGSTTGHGGSSQDFGNATNFDSSGRGGGGMGGGMSTTGSEARRTSLDVASAGGGNVGGGSMGSGEYDNAMGGGLNLPPNVSSGSMGNSGMMDQFVHQHQQHRMRSMTSNLAARQQQLQAQQRELERRQRELEQQRHDLITSMQQRKLMMHSQEQPQNRHSFGGSGSNNMLGGNDMRYDGLLQQQGGGGSGGGAGGMKSNFNDPLTGPYSSTTNSVMGGLGPTASGVGGMSNSDHSSRGAGMGQGTQNSAGGGSHSSGSQQWWICQVCNTKAFASHDEALAHETICVRVQQQQGGNVGNLSGSNSKRGLYDQLQDDSHFNYMNSLSSPQSQRHRTPGGRHRSNHRGMDMSNHNKYQGGMDSSVRTTHTTATSNSYEPVYSTGPFATLERPLPLAMSTDKDWLTPLHCFVRKHCVEVFCATEADVAAPSKGKRKPIQVGQIGIRCPHCHPNSPSMLNKKGSSNEVVGKARERGSVYYPTTIASIYNATMNLLQRHLHSCTAVPQEVMSRYETLKSDDARSGTSKKYWIESALSLGLVDTEMGIRCSAATPPPLPQLTDSQKDMQKHIKDQTATGARDEEGGDLGKDESKELDRSDTNLEEPSPLTAPEDKSYSTSFSYHLLSQMRPCVFTEADRLGKRKGLPPGFRGLACRFCFGGYGSGRFFPSSIKTLSDTSKTLNVLHNHMIRCRKCPATVRETLEQLRGTHDEERAKMKFGSQKAFFARIWDRLHGNGKTSNRSSAPAAPPAGVDKSPKSKPDESGAAEAPATVASPKVGAKRKAPPSGAEEEVEEEAAAASPVKDDKTTDSPQEAVTTTKADSSSPESTSKRQRVDEPESTS